MPTIQFANGKEVEVKGNPTEQDINEIAQEVGATPEKSSGGYVPYSKGSQTKESSTGIVGGAARGLMKAPFEATVGTGTNAYELLSKLLGQVPSTAPRDYVNKVESGIDELIPPATSLFGKGGEALGSLPAMAAQYMTGEGVVNPLTKVMSGPVQAGIVGAINAQGNNATPDVGAMAGQGALSAAQMYGLEKAQGMKLVPGMATGAAVSGIPALLQGDKKDATVQAIIGAGFSTMHPSTPQEFSDFAKQTGEFVKDPKARLKLMIDKARDKMSEPGKLNDEINQDQQDYNEAKVGLSSKFADLKTKTPTYESNLSEAQLAANEGAKSAADKAKEASLKRVNDIASNNLISLDNQLNSFQVKLPVEAGKAAEFVNENLPNVNDSLHRNYQSDLDAMAYTIDSRAEVGNVEVTGFLSDAIGEIARQRGYNIADQGVAEKLNESDPIIQKMHALIGELNPKGALDRLAEKYPVIKGLDLNDPRSLEDFRADNPQIGQELDKAMEQQKKDSNTPFKQVYGRIKSILRSEPYGNPSAGELRDATAKFVAEKSGNSDFQATQKSYAKAKSYLDRLKDLFTTRKGEAFLGRGGDWLNQMSKPTTREAMEKNPGKTEFDRRTYDFLVHGKVESAPKQLATGLGDMGSKLGELNQKISILHEQALKEKDVLNQRVTAIAQSYTAKMQELSKSDTLTLRSYNNLRKGMLDALNKEMVSQKEALKKVYSSRIENKQERLKQINKSFKVAEGTINGVGLVASGFSPILWKAYRVLRGGVTLERTARINLS